MSGTERGATGEAPGLTGVAAPVAHVCRNEAPLVCARVVELHGRQIAGPIVATDHVQQPVNGAHALRRSTQRFQRRGGSKRHGAGGSSVPSDLRFCGTCSCHRPVSTCWSGRRTPQRSSSPVVHHGRRRRTAGRPTHRLLHGEDDSVVLRPGQRE